MRDESHYQAAKQITGRLENLRQMDINAGLVIGSHEPEAQLAIIHALLAIAEAVESVAGQVGGV